MKERLRPMPELKNRPLLSLREISQKYDKAVIRASAMCAVIGTERGPVRFDTERVEIPENLSGNDYLDAVIKVGESRNQIKANVHTVKSNFETRTLPGLKQKKDTIDYLIGIEEKYEKVQVLNTRGLIKDNELQRARLERDTEFEILTTLISQNPEEKKEGTQTLQPITPQISVGQDSVDIASVTEQEEESRRFILPNGEEIGGLIGKLLKLASVYSSENLLSTEEILKRFYQGVDLPVAMCRMRAIIYQARKALKDTGLELVNRKPTSKEMRHGKKGGYYLEIPQEKAITPISIPVQSDQTIDTEGEISLADEARKLLDALTPFDSHHVVTYKQLSEAIAASDPQTLHGHLAAVREVLSQQGLRLAYVSNPNESRNGGYYVESIRKPRVTVKLLGDVIRQGHQQIRLHEEQYKLLWILAYHKGDPVFDQDLLQQVFKASDSEIFNLDKVITTIDQNLTSLTGVSGIIVSGGDEQFGFWHKIKDARIVVKSSYLPVHNTRLEALRILFQDNSVFAKQEIINTLGVTKGKKRASRPLTDPQAFEALRRAIYRLSKRAEENITTDPETNVFVQMTEYMNKYNLTDRTTLVSHLAQKMGITYIAPAFQPTVEIPGLPLITDSGKAETQETTDSDDVIGSVEASEFDNLSRADVSTIAAAVKAHRVLLDSILNEAGVKLIGEPILVELIDLIGEEPLADFTYMEPEAREQFVIQRRIEALEKAKELINKSDFSTICDKIYEQNPNVWCLLVNLSEMDKVQVINGFGSKQGIEFLKSLLANPDARREGFTIMRPRKEVVTSLTQESKGTIVFNTAAEKDGVQKEAADDVEEGTEESVIPDSPDVSAEPAFKTYKPKPRAVEQRDLDLREKVNRYLDDVLSRPEFNVPASGAAVTRDYPRLKKNNIDRAVEDGLVPVSADRDGHYRLDVVAIATLLYLYEHGDNLPARLKKQVQHIVFEEVTKRQK